VPKSIELFDNVKVLYWQHKACLGALSLVCTIWDNAISESVFHTLKTHIIHGCDYKTREDGNKNAI
jgi:hypothetical protein